MKRKWKLCMVSGSIMVFAVLAALILVQTVMSSADGKERKFETTGGTIRHAVSGSMLSESAASGDAVSGKDEKENDADDSTLSDVSCGSVKEKSSLGEQIAMYAERMQGVPYVYGGTKLPDNPISYTYSYSSEEGREITQNDRKDLYGSECGVDSSGLVQEVFKEFDIKLPRSVKEQAKQGTEIKLKDVRPGDIIFYGTSSAKLTHCGIYAGKDKIVHASARTKYVEVSDMNYRRIVKVVRVVEE